MGFSNKRKRISMVLIGLIALIMGCGVCFAYYDGPAKDMGYWCTDCNKHHGPGESCSGGGSSYDDTSYQEEERIDYDAIERNKQAKNFNQQGINYYKSSNYEKAIEQFKQALEKNPDSDVIKRNLKSAEDKLDEQNKEAEQKKKEKEEWDKQWEIKREKDRQKELDAKLFKSHKMPNFPIFGVDISDLKSQTVNINVIKGVDISGVRVEGEDNSPELRRELFRNYLQAYHWRISKNDYDNSWANNIIAGLKYKEPPIASSKDIDYLQPGDVILIAPNGSMSSILNKIDRWASDSSNSPASHTATYLGEKYGKRFYLNNTPEEGPVIMEGKYFLDKYYGRDMNVATLVGQPLSKHQGDELWKGATELAKSGGYGISTLPAANGMDNMVCSEASRWLLLRAGKYVPETKDKLKSKFVKFSPADFYEAQQYFIVHKLYVD